jgi:HD-GYP domain-containing protein (c-di-GMP phosphodiesterase class II)
MAAGTRATLVENVKRAVLVVLLVLLASSTVFVDEIVRSQSLDHELTDDLIVGAMLAVTAAFAAITVLRLSDQRRRLTQSRAMTEAARGITVTGQSAAIVHGLARQAAEILQVDTAFVFRREQNDPGIGEVVAGRGGADELIGRRLGASDGIAGEVLTTGEPLLVGEYAKLGRPGSALDVLSAGGAVPIAWRDEVRGVLAAGLCNGGTFDRRQLEVLARIAALGAATLEQVEMREHLERAAQAGVEALAGAVDTRDQYTAEHSEEVVELSKQVGKRLGLAGNDLTQLEFAARLHDVGKIGVPDAILRKPGPLDKDEWQVIHRHPVWGAEMLARVPELAGVAAIVRFEHERWDGGGYPDGLRGEEIPLAARIVFVCDAYQAMTSDRPYRPSVGFRAAVEELRACAGSQFDPTAVDVLLDVVEEASPVGNL